MPKIAKRDEIEFPPMGKEVLVQCVGFRGLACRNHTGRWTSVVGKKDLPKYIEIIQLN